MADAQEQRDEGGALPPPGKDDEDYNSLAPRRARRKCERRKVRLGWFGKDRIPHFAQPHLAAVLPEFTNAGAERAAALWGLGGQSSGAYLQDHKSQRHAHGNRRQRAAKREERLRTYFEEEGQDEEQDSYQPPRAVSLPALGSRPWGGGAAAVGESAMHGDSSLVDKQEWRSGGAAKSEDRGAWGHWLPDREKRLVQLAGMKRKELRRLCSDRNTCPGNPTITRPLLC